MSILVKIGLFAWAALWLAFFAAKYYRVLKRQFADRQTYVVAFVFLAAASSIVAQKKVFTFDDILADGGSYATNDVVHVEIKPASPYLPSDFAILVYFRDGESTNAADWVQLLPTYRWSEYAAASNGSRFVEYPLSDATNYNFAVYADFVPEPTVHTNGVWQIRGFAVPDGSGGDGALFAFPNSKTRKVP